MSIAIYIVHWPGKDVPACLEHADKLTRLGAVMGFAVSSTMFLAGDDEIVECSNCANEQKLSEAANG